MSLTKGNMRALIAMLKEACLAAGACAKRFQEMYVDATKRKDFVQKLTALIQEVFGRFNAFNTDGVVKQTFFEPKNWARPVDEQLELLRVYLPDAWVDPEYLATRQAEPVPAGFVRVAVPKLAYLEQILRPTGLEPDEPWDIYEHIGVAIEHVCGEHESKHGTKFKNWRKGELGPDRVRCHQQAMERRRQAEESVPGDIMILDVDLGNRTLGGKEKLCHTPRWSREEIGLTDNLMDLGSVDVGYILLLNEARLTKYDLCIDTTLEEYFWDGDGWVASLCWDFNGGQLHFDYGYADYADGNYATGVAMSPGLL